ncbi:translation initiation factor IF-2-like [Trachypithecus francoisi]|uniref:translation initiation factor IF-2-like n=1 Tax=Trachypithecus francoisi TaxID=54180 RepID=UPI00141ABE6A|nr:translation initiation factor IF-2-like [Trachypithecus francoisi]
MRKGPDVSGRNVLGQGRRGKPRARARSGLVHPPKPVRAGHAGLKGGGAVALLSCGLTGAAPPFGGVGYYGSSSTGRHTAPAKASSVPLAIFQPGSHEGRGGGEKQSRKSSARRPRRWSPPCQRFRTGSPSAPRPPELSVRAQRQTEVAGIYLPQELGAAAAAHAPLQHEGAGRGQRGGARSPRTQGCLPRRRPSSPPLSPATGLALAPGTVRGLGGRRRRARLSGSSRGAGLGAAGSSRPPSLRPEVGACGCRSPLGSQGRPQSAGLLPRPLQGGAGRLRRFLSPGG